MNLNYIFGMPRSGKSNFVYNQIKKDLENTDKNLILIVPEQVTYEKEKELINFLEVEGIMKVQIISFTRLEYKILEEVGGIKEKEINDYGKIMLLREIFETNRSNLKVFGRAYLKEGFLKNFNTLIKEFKDSSIDVNYLENFNQKDYDNFGFSRKIEDIKLVYNDLEKKLENAYLDNEDKKYLFADRIKDSNFIKNSIVYVDEFSKFSGLQIKIIRELFKTSQNMYITFPLDNPENSDREELEVPLKTYKKIDNQLKELTNNIKTYTLNRKIKIVEDIQHLEENFFNYFPKKYKKKVENIEVYYGQNPYEEVEMTANRIIEILKKHNIQYKDVGILVSDSELYIPIIEKVFKEYEISFFADYKKNLSNNSFIIFLISYLDCIIYNYRQEDVFRLLKIGYWNLNYTDIESIENYALKWGVEGNKWFKKFTYKDKKDDLEYIENTRKKVVEILPNEKNLKRKNTIEFFVKTMCSEIDKLNVNQRIEKNTERLKKNNYFEEAYINNQVWNSVMELFDQMNTILGDKEVNIKEFKKILESGLLEFEVGIIPTKIDSITVGSFERTKLSSKKAIFILGVNDGSIPRAYDDNGILIDEEKDMLKKEGVELKNSDYLSKNEKFDFFNILSRGEEKLYFSYSIGGYDGGTQIRSTYIDKIKDIFPDLEIKSTITLEEDKKYPNRIKPALNQTLKKISDKENIDKIDDIYLKALRWFLNNKDIEFEKILNRGLLYTNNKETIDKTFIEKLYKTPLSLSPYSLETFSQCPFRFFVEYGLEPEERREYTVDKRDIGKIYHSSLEKFTKNIAEKYEDNINVEDALEVMKESIKDSLDEEKDKNSPLEHTYRNKYLKKKIDRVGMETAKGVVNQLNRSDFKPKHHEVSIGNNSILKPIEKKLDSGKIIELTGRIDRVDICKINDKCYINVVDYKSKKEKIDLTSIINGMQLQLFIYLDALINNGEKLIGVNPEIGGVFYFNILLPWIDGDKHLVEEEIEKEIIKSFKMEGYFIEDKELIEKLDKKIGEEKESTIAKIKLNKDESISKTSQTLDKKSFDILLKIIRKKIKEIGEEITSGKILIKPYKKGRETPCKWCSYNDICQFDSTMPDNQYNTISKINKKDFEKIINEAGDECD